MRLSQTGGRFVLAAVAALIVSTEAFAPPPRAMAAPAEPSAMVVAATPGAMAVPPTSQAAALDRDELDARLQSAIGKLEQGDALTALLELEGILARDDRYWPAYYQLGRAQAEMGDVLGAKASLMRAAELNPGDPDLHFLVATVTWQLADFSACWTQAIAAIQAGFDRTKVDQLLTGLGQYSEPPADYEERLAAPRVVVAQATEGDEADPDIDPRLIEPMYDPRLEEISLGLRTAVFRAQSLGLVQDPRIARYRIEFGPAPGADGPMELAADEPFILRVALFDVARATSEEDAGPAIETEIAVLGDGRGARTQAALRDFVDDAKELITQ